MVNKGEINKSRKLKGITFVVLLILLLTLVGIAFARYVTSLNGTTTADVAKWSFKVYDGLTHTENIENLSITRTDDNHHVEEGTIAPRNLWKISNRYRCNSEQKLT